MSQNTFTYFAYGSNLLQQRIRLGNPSAKRSGIARLDNYQLNFGGYSKRWHGSPATIVPAKGSVVWGALWSIDVEHIENLDRQEGGYFSIEVDADCPDGGAKKCRTYQLAKTVSPIQDIKDLPSDRRPSKIYLKTILLGAKESKLPDEYQEYLKNIPHNGYDGDVEVAVELPKIDI